MKDYVIVTDSCCDLPYSYLNKEGIEFVPLNLIMDNQTYQDDLGQSISPKDFYQMIEQGALPTTSQPTPEAFYQVYKEAVSKGKDVLYIGVSSSLSGTFNSANIGKQMIEEEFPDANIVCFTTLIGSLGQGLFLMKANEMKKEGKSLNEVVDYLSEKVKTQQNLILIKDLFHLKRGGRLSGVQTVIASALKINPILEIDKEGKVAIVDKIRGKNKAVKRLADFVVENAQNPESQIIAISHANALEDAEKVKKEIESRISVKEFIIGDIGPVIGCHSGSGAVVVFFLN